MPVPGPRGQYGPDPGYRNPGDEQPTKFQHWDSAGPIMWPGRSPGMMAITLRGCVLGAGQIRRMWRQSVGMIPAQAPYSWSSNTPTPIRPGLEYPALGVTRALRYMTRSVYMGGGEDNTRFAEMHTIVKKQNRYKTVTVAGGSVPGRPTTRNRLTSFGSRVPTLNQAVSAASNQPVGPATQS